MNKKNNTKENEDDGKITLGDTLKHMTKRREKKKHFVE